MLSSLIHGDRAKLSCSNEASEQVFVPIEVLQETLDFVCQHADEVSLSCPVLLSRRVHGSTPALFLSAVQLIAFLSHIFLFLFSFQTLVLSLHPSPALPPVAPRGTMVFLTASAESLWTLCNVNRKTTQNVSFPFLLLPRLRFADTPGLVIGAFIMQAVRRMT